MRAQSLWPSVLVSSVVSIAMFAVSPAIGQTFSNFSIPVNLGSVNSNLFDG